jgi:16S rRNA (guanine1516-N2)-methyltransferase
MVMIRCVGYETEELKEKAQSIAKQLNFRLDKEGSPSLFVSTKGLTLKIPGFSLLSADFNMSTWAKRKAEGKKQGVVRACKPTNSLKIIDATAGWGKDAAILASFGSEVLMLERDPIMAALLEDALSRQTPSDKDNLPLSFKTCNSLVYLTNLATVDFPDVIYIDPMHPQRTKTALVKKDMYVLQEMIGADADALELIQLAITRVKRRVVVKWPQKLKSLLKADASIEGKTVRFDVYLPK